ncbi:MAG: methyltransferase domain-containing protein [Sedimentisphaerales bacterium]|nr:methyltransferase domain-containing protein [Sedimentisphaerales bacterium]
MAKKWTAQEILDVARSFQPACVLTAGAVLDVFTPLHDQSKTAQTLACGLDADPRAMTILLDALVAMELLTKRNNQYSAPSEVAKLLSEKSPDNILPMLRHQSNCLRRWSALSEVVQNGGPAETGPSIRGAAADQADFIGAMQNVSEPVAIEVVNRLRPLTFRHVLDVGAGPGTWTIALLRAVPEARATLFDLPPVIPMAERRMTEAGLDSRVELVGGDYYEDAMPDGVDLVWLGAVCHQNSRQENRALFAKAYTSLVEGGAVIIRDVVMDASRTRPIAGALFAVNMLVATEAGGTYTFDEYREDLRGAGFDEVVFVHQDESMNCLIRAEKKM